MSTQIIAECTPPNRQTHRCVLASVLPIHGHSVPRIATTATFSAPHRTSQRHSHSPLLPKPARTRQSERAAVVASWAYKYVHLLGTIQAIHPDHTRVAGHSTKRRGVILILSMGKFIKTLSQPRSHLLDAAQLHHPRALIRDAKRRCDQRQHHQIHSHFLLFQQRVVLRAHQKHTLQRHLRQ